VTRPKHFLVIGDPVGHSLSPAMHRAAFDVLGLPHTFDSLRVPPEELPAVLDRLRRGDLHGLNVTVPHKIPALRLCDVFTDEVAMTGAVNTLWMDATGRLVGSNTDVDGLRADLLNEDLVPQSALVLGAGGAARAAVVSLANLCSVVDVAARRDDQAELLVREVGIGRALEWATMAPRSGERRTYDLVVNATSAGMSGGPPGEAIADALERASRSTQSSAYDLVYRPRETPFLARAAKLGMRPISGLGMLAEQGARALSIFLGTPISPEVRQAMRRAAAEALNEC